jgi:hypothetical protein
LAKLVDPSNEPKTDKLSILGEAIRFVQQTQVENSQLRQLNKFLEVSDNSKSRAVTLPIRKQCFVKQMSLLCFDPASAHAYAYICVPRHNSVVGHGASHAVHAVLDDMTNCAQAEPYIKHISSKVAMLGIVGYG